MHKIIFSIFILIFLTSPAAFSFDETSEITISPYKTNVYGLIGNSYSIIDNQEQFPSSYEALRSTKAVNIYSQGGAGQTKLLSIRGSNTDHVLVLIDGVEINDPSSSSRLFDFSKLSRQNIERIEVLKGPQSTAYGSEAMGGVINIITKKPTTTTFGISTGSFSTYSSDLSTNLKFSNSFEGSISLGYLQTNSFSAAQEDDGNSEDDPYSYGNINLKLNKKFSNNSKINFFTDYSNSTTAFDRGGGEDKDDPNYHNNTEEWINQLKYDYVNQKEKFTNEKVFSTVKIKEHYIQRENINSPDDNSSDELDEFFKSHTHNIEWINRLKVTNEYLLVTGVEYKNEHTTTNIIDRKVDESYSVFVQNLFNHKRYFYSYGFRLENYVQQKLDPATFQLSSGYKFKNNQIKFSAASAFKAPSTYQLHDPTYGNNDLEPEQNISWEVGLKNKSVKNLFLDLVYFENRFKDLFGFDSSFKTINVNEAIIQGVEISADTNINKQLSLTSNLTYLINFKDETKNEELVRRSQNTYNLGLVYIYNDYLLSLNGHFRGSRDDFDASTSERVRMNSYSVLNFYAEYLAKENSLRMLLGAHNEFKYYFKVNNLLDQQYEEVNGYTTEPLSLYVGAKIEL